VITTLYFLNPPTNQNANKETATSSTASTIEQVQKKEKPYGVKPTVSDFIDSNNQEQTAIVEKADDYIVECKNSSTESNDLAQEVLQAKESHYIEQLKESDVPEHQLAYLLTFNKQSKAAKLSALADFSNQYPHNKLAFERLLNLCVSQDNQNICNDNLFSRIESVDKNNGYLWQLVASIKARRNDDAGFIEALSRGNKKSFSTYYRFETIDFYKNSMQELSHFTFNELMVSATGIGTAIAVNIDEFVQYCIKNSKNNTLLADTCFQTGLQMEQGSKDSLFSGVGINLQENYYQGIDRSDAIKNLQQRKQQLMPQFPSKQQFQSYMLMMFDEELAQNWLNNAANNGELEATNQLIADAILFSKNENYNPCPIDDSSDFTGNSKEPSIID